MSNISQYLEQIRTSVYGKDVRNAIVYSLTEMNNDLISHVDQGIDSTLTSETLPAQAKAAGDAAKTAKAIAVTADNMVHKLSEIRHYGEATLYMAWEQGSLGTQTGAEYEGITDPEHTMRTMYYYDLLGFPVTVTISGNYTLYDCMYDRYTLDFIERVQLRNTTTSLNPNYLHRFITINSDGTATDPTNAITIKMFDNTQFTPKVIADQISAVNNRCDTYRDVTFPDIYTQISAINEHHYDQGLDAVNNRCDVLSGRIENLYPTVSRIDKTVYAHGLNITEEANLRRTGISTFSFPWENGALDASGSAIEDTESIRTSDFVNFSNVVLELNSGNKARTVYVYRYNRQTLAFANFDIHTLEGGAITIAVSNAYAYKFVITNIGGTRPSQNDVTISIKDQITYIPDVIQNAIDHTEGRCDDFHNIIYGYTDLLGVYHHGIYDQIAGIYETNAAQSANIDEEATLRRTGQSEITIGWEAGGLDSYGKPIPDSVRVRSTNYSFFNNRPVTIDLGSNDYDLYVFKYSKVAYSYIDMSAHTGRNIEITLNAAYAYKFVIHSKTGSAPNPSLFKMATVDQITYVPDVIQAAIDARIQNVNTTIASVSSDVDAANAYALSLNEQLQSVKDTADEAFARGLNHTIDIGNLERQVALNVSNIALLKGLLTNAKVPANLIFEQGAIDINTGENIEAPEGAVLNPTYSNQQRMVTRQILGGESYEFSKDNDNRIDLQVYRYREDTGAYAGYFIIDPFYNKVSFTFEEGYTYRIALIKDNGNSPVSLSEVTILRTWSTKDYHGIDDRITIKTQSLYDYVYGSGQVKGLSQSVLELEQTTSDLESKIPDAPNDAGTYILRASVVNGVKTYKWVKEG